MSELFARYPGPISNRDFFKVVIEQGRSSIGLSRIEFAHMVGVSPETVRQWEHYGRYPSATSRTKIAEALCHIVAIYKAVSE